MGGVSSVDYWQPRGVRISGSNAGYTMFRGCVKSTGYLLHSPDSLSLPIPCVTVFLHILTGLYLQCIREVAVHLVYGRVQLKCYGAQ